VTNLLKSGGFN